MWGNIVSSSCNEGTKSFFKNYFLSTKGLIGSLIVVCLATLFLYNIFTRPNAINVIIDGQLVAAASDEEQVEQTIEAICQEKEIEGLPLNIINDIKFEPTRVSKEDILDDIELTMVLNEKLEFHYGAVAITINGQKKVIVEDKKTAENVIEAIKESYLPKEDDKKINILEVKVEENVSFDLVEVDASEIVSFEEAVEIMKYGEEKITYYEVQPGDSLWTIARDNNMKVSELEEANPEINSTLLQIGQDIRLVKPEPALNVKVVYEQTLEETISYPVKYVNTDSLWRGQQKVNEPGANGKKEVTYLVTKLNEYTQEKEVINEVVIEEPKTKVVAVGTKLLVASRGGGGTGQLGWPLRGAITSPFGYRGRSLHTGIDIAGSTGDPIYSAEAGKVIFSGWRGNYGNLLIIDHGDGVTTYYAHCSKLLVGVGKTVSRGDVIARVGSTGRSTGPHLHFEVRINGSPDNPSKYLRN